MRRLVKDVICAPAGEVLAKGTLVEVLEFCKTDSNCLVRIAETGREFYLHVRLLGAAS